MASKEDMERIRGVVRQANDAREEQDRQARQTLNEIRERKKAQQEQDRQRIVATGVIDLFEGLSQAGFLGSCRVHVGYGTHDNKSTLTFEIKTDGKPNDDYITMSEKRVSAYFEGDNLVLEGANKVVVKDRGGMVDALGLAVSEPEVYTKLVNNKIGDYD